MRYAAGNGHDGVVVLLLADRRVQQALTTMQPLPATAPWPIPALTRLRAAVADERRWRRRRALALVREQRRVARDHWKWL